MDDEPWDLGPLRPTIEERAERAEKRGEEKHRALPYLPHLRIKTCADGHHKMRVIAGEWVCRFCAETKPFQEEQLWTKS
jgi:hypothetical protein